MPDVIHRAFEKKKFRDVLLDKFEVRVAAEMRDVVHAAGDKIVNADDPVTARDQQVGEMRAEETGGTGDDGGGLFFQGVKWLNGCFVEPSRGRKVIQTVHRFNH